MDEENEVCHVCGGSGVGKATGRTQQECCPYDPIQCQHCNGSEVEPN